MTSRSPEQHKPGEKTVSAKANVRLPKRFYKDVHVSEDDSGFIVTLDGRQVKTPRRESLQLPTCELAEAIAAEWLAQHDVIDPATMPLTKLCNSAIDGAQPAMALVIDDIVKYSGHDLICYRADGPPALAGRQTELWDPVLAWAERSLGARWQCALGVMPVTQSAQSAQAVRAALAEASPFQLTGLHELTTLTGSALLALSYKAKHLTFDALWQAAHVDEDYQIAQWGEDAEAGARREVRYLEAKAADTLMTLATGS